MAGPAALSASAPAAPPVASSRAEQPQRFPLALAYLCGSFLLGVYLASTSAPWLPIAGGALLLCAGAWWRGGARATLLALACVVALATGAWRADAAAYRDGVRQVGHYAGHQVVLTGIVDGEPQPGGRGDNLPVQVRALSVDGRAVVAGGRILVHYTGPEAVAYGDVLALRGRLEAPYSAPGFDYQAYLAGQGIHAVMSYPSLRVTGHGDGNPLEALALGLRAALRRAIAAMLPRDEAALLIGILLGAPTRSLGALTDAFVAVGMIHVVAISGLKVALVAGMLSALCRPLPRRWRWPLPLLGVLLYTAVSGATPSGLRSALMWTLALMALQTGRRGYVWVSLALVAAGMVCWHPLLLWDTGFQLSVAGTAGIVLFTDWFARPLRRLPPFLRESTAVTLAAQVATLPITAIGFGQVSLIGPVANGLLLPLLGPIMALGAGCAALGALMPALAPWLGYALHPWLALFIAVVRLFAALPSATLPWPVVPLALVAPYYAALLVLARLRVVREVAGPAWHGGPFAVLRGWPLSLRVALVPTAVACGLWLARPTGQPVLWLAGVGKGQALLLQTPGGQSLLIDGGDLPAATQALLGSHLPFWQRSLAATLLTEPDLGHAGGLLGLSELYQIDRAYDPGSIYPSITYARWRAELRESRIPERKARTGMRLDLGGGVYVDVLSPPALTVDEAPAPAAYRIRVGHLAVLVPNREAVADDPAPLRAGGACLDVLVLPSRADPTAAAALVRALHPRLVTLAPPASAGDPGLQPPDLAPLPAGTRVWQAGSGKELRLGAGDGHCR